MNGYLWMKDLHTLFIKNPIKKYENKSPRIKLHSLFLSLVFNGGFGIFLERGQVWKFYFLMGIGVFSWERD